MRPRRLPTNETIDLLPLELRADILPASLNPEARTVDVVFSTGAPVERTDFFTGERWIESLSVEPEAIRLARLNSGRAPFLNAHTADSVGDQLGVVQPGSARIKDGQAIATIRFSKRDTVEPIWQDVRDGIIGNVSVGYRVHKYERIPGDEDTRRPERRHAVDWEPYEISAVPMGADAGAMIRATRDPDRMLREPCLLVTRRGKESSPMSKPTTRGRDADRDREQDEEKTRGTRPAVVDPDEDGDCPDGYEMGDDGKCHEIRAASELSERELGVEAERKRQTGILNAASALRYRFDHPKVAGHLRNGTALEAALQDLLATFRGDVGDADGPSKIPSGAARVTRDPLETARAGITGALLHRIDPDRWKLDDNSRLYRTYSVVRCAEELLEYQGVRTRHLSKLEIIGKALEARIFETRAGYHTTSDFALILGDVANKSLRAIYTQLAQSWLPLATRVTIPDFRPLQRLDFGEGPPLKRVLEHGEFTRGTIETSKETFQLATYGRIFAVTRQALVNDDLDAFGRMPALWARSARNLESDIVWGEILANRVMSDGNAVFSAAHNNLVTPGTLISIGSLGQARAMLARQKGADGSAYLSLVARYLVVPPGVQTLAEQFVTAVTPGVSGAVNPFAGQLVVISEPRLEGGIVPPDGGAVIAGDVDAWYVFASPEQIPIIEYGYLDGQDGPVLDTRLGFDIDGIEWKARLDFAARIMNYRGGVKNEGATVPVTLGAQMNVPVVLSGVPVAAEAESGKAPTAPKR